jgi:hypothetical protein
MNIHYNKQLSRLSDHAPDQAFLLDEAELFGDPGRVFREFFDCVGEPDDAAVPSVFASHLYRVSMPLHEAKVSLPEFSHALHASGVVGE